MNAKGRSLLTWLYAVLVACSISPSAWAVITCNFSATGVAFGVYAQASPTPLDSTGAITLSCSKQPGDTPNLTYSIALSAGGGSFAQRTMTATTGTLNYNLYTDLSRTVIWGDGSAGTQVTGGTLHMSGTVLTSVIVTAYGRIPALQAVDPGSYTDSIVVTVTY